jgi:hypothetical protein
MAQVMAIQIPVKPQGADNGAPQTELQPSPAAQS